MPHNTPYASQKRNSLISTSVKAKLVPYISNYYSLLNDSPKSLSELHSNEKVILRWQLPQQLFGKSLKPHGSTLTDDNMLYIRSFGYQSVLNLFCCLPTISCNIPVEIFDIHQVTSELYIVTIHGTIINNGNNYPFFQIFHIMDLDRGFTIMNNIFFVYNKVFESLEKKLARNDNNNTEDNGQIESLDLSNNITNKDVHNTEGDGGSVTRTFPTYQDQKLKKVKPQIRIIITAPNSTITDKDITTAINNQLKSVNDGYAIAVHRNHKNIIVQVDSTQSSEILCQRGIYIQGVKYKVTFVNTHLKKHANHKHSQAKSYSKELNNTVKQEASKANEDNDGWITVRGTSKSRKSSNC
ncbi:uncharacterized protein CMU_033070 [Cryptosporidium muris RN66]|uniref:NTF2 domain-containing protein n=1 Tax=Cryptosporidium muris (strain RN66) TaxID=441375 RepID=B6AFD1_CRYMR|nr:uncharacterized protein CMU_033070 [Cryptosporidium muris RN66]EEA06922.1 hypothetical protein, conserved [Cryptosporidium muris RN66]|eukprot:XP_002141271.1 hypothetical protein [Cryptosporidium muris RN66]